MGQANSKRFGSEPESDLRIYYRVIDAIRQGNYGYAKEKCHELGYISLLSLTTQYQLLRGGESVAEYFLTQLVSISGLDTKGYESVTTWRRDDLLLPLNRLQTAIRDGDLETVNTVLGLEYPHNKVFDAITEEQGPCPSGLWIAAFGDNPDIFLTLLDRMTPYLHKYFEKPENILSIGECIAMKRTGSMDMIAAIFQRLEMEGYVNYGELHDSICAKWVVLCARGLCGENVFAYLLQQIPNGDRSIVDLLKFSADSRFPTGQIRTILEKISIEEFPDFITEYHSSINYGTFLNSTCRKGSVLSVTVKNNDLILMTEIVGLLNQIKMSRKHHEKIQANLELANKHLTQEMMELCHQYLDPDKFCIPSSRDAQLRMHGIVCYNEGDREGADEEASIISESLASVGVKLSGEIKNWSSNILIASLKRFCHQVKDTCSLVVVCLMSHGAEGILYGNYSTGDQLEISDVFTILNTKLPEQIPKVVIVQACQGEHMSRSQGEPSKQSDAKCRSGPRVGSVRNQTPSPYYMRLTGSNIVVLSATGPGELATRNHFIPSLAETIRQADGKKGIYEMLMTAKSEMRHSHDKTAARQNPMFMSNAYKKVVLPQPMLDETTFVDFFKQF